MTNDKAANQLAHEMVTEAAEKVRTIRELAAEMGLPEKDVANYVAKIAYRRAYNTRPEVVLARKVRNAERAAVQKAITQRLKDADKLSVLNRLAELAVKG